MNDSADTDGRPPIVQYWDAEEVPGYIQDLIATFRERNPDMPHRLFDERTAGELIAERIGQREAEAFRACAVPTMQSDYFRYCAAYALGGVYVDAGFQCVAPLQTLLPGAGEARLFRVEPFGYLLSGFFAFGGPGHPLPRLTLDVITANVERRAAESVQMVTGPWSLSALSLIHRLGSEPEHRQAVAEGGVEQLRRPFLERARTMPPSPAGRREVDRMIEPLFDTVGDFARIVEAFDGVHVVRFRETAAWIRKPDSPLPYKESERYWVNWQRQQTIFR